MPLPKRLVEPVHVARGTIPEDFPLPSELEAATNGTLANTVRQLSSLSRHAEDLFGELAREAHSLAARANSLQTRIDRLAIKVTQLDSNVEEVSLQDIHMRKAFKSFVVFDQQVVSRDTMPTAMLETYQTCDKPPPLDKLNSYREDGKDGLKFYTDANYFFDLWRQEMLKDTERMMHDRGKKPHRPRNEGGRHKKRVRQPHNTRERQRQLAVGHGEYIMPQNIHYRTPQALQQQDEGLMPMGMQDPRPPRPNSIELRRNYPEETNPGVIYSGANQALYSPRHTHSPTDSQHYRANYPGYEDYQHYAQGQVMSEGYPTPNNHTPSRGSRAGSQRPSQPPPAPPSTNNSSNSTPTVSSANNTPTRGRSMSTGRETLPPPPPPPVETVGSPPSMNGVLPSHLRARSRSGSRSGSPLPTHTPTPPSNHTPHSQSLSRDNTPEPQPDLPPPPPTPDQHQLAPSPPPPLTRPSSPSCNIPPPPPPPPPPPMVLSNGPLDLPTSPPPMMNGDVTKSPIKQIISTSPPKLSPPKSNDNSGRTKTANALAPVFDPRNDLLKAIRDGIKLRKVEKIEQKEVERVNALHDVASILARRVAVEFSDSDSASESEYDSEGWGEQETSA